MTLHNATATAFAFEIWQSSSWPSMTSFELSFEYKSAARTHRPAPYRALDHRATGRSRGCGRAIKALEGRTDPDWLARARTDSREIGQFIGLKGSEMN